MNPLDSVFRRFDERESQALGLVRAFIGIALVVRAALLVADPGALTRIAGSVDWYWMTSLVVVLHGLGGVLLAVGLWTRWAALGQIPVLLGATLVVHRSEGLMTTGQSLELSVLVLFLLCVILCYGAGAWSLDRRSAG